MTDLSIAKQLRLHQAIGRSLDNYKKIGRNNLTAAKIRSRISTLKDVWQQFQDNHDELAKSTSTATRATLDYFKEGYYELAEEVFNATLDQMSEDLEALSPVVSQARPCESGPARADASTFSLSHLPPIRLPPFDGNYAEWETFRDRFTSLITLNTELSDFARMHFLASSLKGRALECIGNLAITADNFSIAWRTLTARFENKRRLLSSHLSALLGLSTVTRESASELQILVDKVNIAVASLASLDRSPSELWNDIVVHLVTQKLDPATRKAWNLKTSDVDTPPTHDSLNRFLSSRIRALEDSVSSSAAKSVPVRSVTSPRVHVATAIVNAPSACPLCKSRHYINACPEFSAQNSTQRRDTVKRLKRCFNCLSASHSVQACKSKYSCRSCNKRHHSMLHADLDSGPGPSTITSQATPTPPSIAQEVAVTSLLASAKPSGCSQVLLATAWVQVSTDSGRAVAVRALLDQGSEATFMSENLAQLLRAKRIRQPISISAVGGIHVGTVRHAASISISPRDSETPSFATTALILASLTSYSPKRVSDLSSIAHLYGLEWADADPTSSDPINLIIGADIYSDLILQGVRRGKRGQPAAQNSVFGWIISGPLASSSRSSSLSRRDSSADSARDSFTVHCTHMHYLADEIRRFWETEELPPSQSLTPDDEQCETHFRHTHSRLADGRYVVRLPFKRGPPIEIGRSRQSAERMFNSLLRRFHAKSDLESEYSEFMREYEVLGHMRRVPEGYSAVMPCVYIPHHPVFRDSSTTTHLRVVFNASNITSNGSSLNDTLLAGPKLQADLPAILLRWRQFKYVYTADIAKMYRQILIDDRDVDYQRILWKGTPNEGPLDYQLLTVTYGMTCAPFLALRVIKCLVEDDGSRFPLAIPILQNHIYVDDVLFGGDDINQLKQSRDHLVSLLHHGGFKLRKWASNSSVLLEDIDPSDHGLACDKQIATDEKLNVLGVVWNPARDNFQFKVTLSGSIPKSKRSILSAIARLYDPLGWVTPVTVSAKILMQQLWRSRITWDEAIPESLFNQWQSIYFKLSCLDELRLVRWTGVQDTITRMEIHGFADASTVAYAASVYLKVISASGEITISLLAGKSRVAPITPLTVPRLELSAALLLVRLLNFVRTSSDLRSVPCHCWTDSTIVLSWLRSHPSRWKTFVANRVTAIQSGLPDAEWRHVPTSDNPADCASRGLTGDDLLTHAIWWQGPPWLRHSKEAWPQELAPSHSDTPVEEKVVAVHVAKSPAPWDLASRYSSWPRLLRVTAYIFRFVNSCRRAKVEAPSLPAGGTALSSDECARARIFWIKRIQAELFSSEIRVLTDQQTVAKSSSVAALRPFLDRDGILRVGGRLRHAPLPYLVRHPILLASHPLVTLIVVQAHLRVLHGGLQLTLSTLRQDFWLIRARSLVKSAIYRCVVCVRERAAVPEQLMGDLPEMRVTPSRRSFVHCGVDYAGPVKTRASAGRGIASRKSYIAVFVCLATRAIHLEAVSDYSTAAFLNAYARFCSRRGLPTTMYSDNGTTFVGAEKELHLAYNGALRDPDFLNKTACDNVSWKFIPPSAPHFGGMWEAGVRSVKHHLRRILGSHALSFEEFSTLLCRIEACLNSRPIAPLSDTLDEYECLTPGHFLIGTPLTVAPEPSLAHLNENRLSRWQLVRHITERFWKLWASDYVNTLQQRSKWRSIRPALTIGQLVLLRNTNLPPCKWELGRITQLHAGPDGLARVVTVKTADSEYRRPIVKLCVLPVTSQAPTE